MAQDPRHTLPDHVLNWLKPAPSPPDDVVAEATIAFEADPDGWLASVYSQLVMPAHRRHLGTFFTPSPEVGLMLEMWDAHQPRPQSVVDVGAGVGVFTAAAATRWPTATVYAVDINPVTLGLMAVRLYGLPERQVANVHLVHADYTSWIRDFEPPQGRRLILGNPPYTRAQLMSVPERRRLQTLTNGLCGSRASLSTVITAITLLELGPDDGLCLLLPAGWLEADYARELRSALWESKRRRIELRLVESALFDDAQVDAVALLVGPETNSAGVFASNWSEPSPPQLAQDGPAPGNWRRLFGTSTPVAATKVPSSKAVLLEDVAKIQRGIATGANYFFVLLTEAVTDLSLQRAFARRIVSRLRDTPDTDAIPSEPDDKTRWLLEASPAQVKKSVRLARYIESGEEDALHERHLCGQREHWYDLRSEVFIPDVIIGPMSRDHFRILNNGASAAITNNLYGLTWTTDVTEMDRNNIVAWLRSASGQEALRGIARHQGDGLMKLEPRAVQRLPLPATLAKAIRTPGE